MKFDVRDAGNGCLVLTCHGGLSWEDRELLAASVEQFVAGRETFQGAVLDMGTVEFVNSAGLGALFQLVQRLHGRSAQLALYRVPPTLKRLFHAVGLDRLATMCDDLPAALQALQTPTALRTAESGS